MEVMTRIEKVFLDIGNLKLKAPSNHHLVRVGLNGPMHTELINPQLGLIRTLNPVHYNGEAVAVSYEPWEFYRGPNRELSRARIVVGCFSGSAVSSPSTLQLLGEPQQERPSEPISEEPREERIGFVVPEIPDADSASSEVSDSEDDHPRHPQNGNYLFQMGQRWMGQS